MAMIELHAQVVNIFKANDSTDRETGEVIQGKFKIQVMGKMPLQSGESQLQLQDLSCNEPDLFKPFLGKWIACAVGFWSQGERSGLYFPKGAKPVEIDAKSA